MKAVELKEVDIPQTPPKIPVQTGLNEKARENVAGKLKVVLADSYLLMLKTHYYHWNVKGTLFKSLHDLTEEQYMEIFESISHIAERIRALDHEAPGTFSEYSKLSTVNEAQSGLSDLEMAADLLQIHQNIIPNLRDALRTADEVNDEVTVDLMVQRLSVHEKNAWMLRSLLEQ